MSDEFDPYHKWLGIPPEEQPADHYRLLAIARFESDSDVIEGAADRQMGHVRTFQTGPHSARSQTILNELAAAKLRLLDAHKKAAYDAELRGRLAAARPSTPVIPQARPILVASVRPLAPMPVQAVAPALIVTGGGAARHSARRRRSGIGGVASAWWGLAAVAIPAFAVVGYLIWAKSQRQQKAAPPARPTIDEAARSTKPRPKRPLPKPPDPSRPATEGGQTSPPPTNPEVASVSVASNGVPTPEKEMKSDEPSSERRSLADLAKEEKPAANAALTATEAFSLKEHTGAVTRIAFHRTRPLLVSAGKDGQVLLWNLPAKAKQTVLHKFRQEVWAVKFSPDGQLLAIANRNWGGSRLVVKTLAGVQVGQPVKDFKNPGGAVASIAYSPDGRLFAAGQDNGTVRLWETSPFHELPPVSLDASVWFVAFGPISYDRKHLAEYLIAAGCKDGSIKSLRATTVKAKAGMRRVLEPTSVAFPKQRGVTCVRYSHDGMLLGATRIGGLISLYDVRTGAAAHEMRASNGNADWISFHPRCPWIATAHWNDRVARIWHQETGAMLCELRGHTAGVFCAEFSPDGRHVATASEDCSIKLWDLAGPEVPPAVKGSKKMKLAALTVGE